MGLAGTITTVTAHALGLESFEPEAIDGARLDVGTALASCEAIVHSTAAERESWGYLRFGCREVIAAGALMWSEVIARVVEATAARGAPAHLHRHEPVRHSRRHRPVPVPAKRRSSWTAA